MPNNPLFDTINSESRDLFREIAISSDRGAGIVGAAVLDDMLGMLMAALGKNGEGLSFDAKIKECYKLEFISEKEHHDLHSIRSIRNYFAHTRHRVSFEDAAIQTKCRNLSLAMDFWARSEKQPADSSVWFLSGWVMLANVIALRLRNAVGGSGELNTASNLEIVFGGGSAPK